MDIDSNLEAEVLAFASRVDALDGLAPHHVDEYISDEAKREQLLLKILPVLYWENLHGVLMSAMEALLLSRHLLDLTANQHVQVLRMTEYAGCHDLLTEEYLAYLSSRDWTAPVFLGQIGRLADRRRLLGEDGSLDLVSLGHDCLPWDLVNRYGLRPSGRLAALSTPFNLAAHSQNALVHLLRTGFSDYVDQASYSDVRTATGKVASIHKPTRSVFNHHLMEHWREDGRVHLLRFVESRVGTLQELLREGSGTFLFRSRTVTDADEAAKYREALHETDTDAFPIARNRMIVMNVDPGGERRVDKIADGFFFVQVPFPTQDYRWWVDFGVPAGREFELTLLEFILDIARRDRRPSSSVGLPQARGETGAPT